MFLAEGRDIRPSVEGVDFDLVDSRDGLGFRIDEFLELRADQTSSAHDPWNSRQRIKDEGKRNNQLTCLTP